MKLSNSLIDNFFRPIKLISLIFFAAYIISMLVFPWFNENWSWKDVQKVWDRWQTLNVGVLAFISSVFVFNAARLHENRQREINYVAAKAFLPEALSILSRYFKESAEVIVKIWDSNRQNLEISPPDLTKDYKPIFENCIKYAPYDVGLYLSNVLMLLQIHEARLNRHIKNINDENMITSKYDLMTYLYRLGELCAYVNNLFPYARGMDEFSNRPLDWEDFRNAYGVLDIYYTDIFIDNDWNLKAFTLRRLANGKPDFV